MSYTVLARKYRSRTLDEVVGQEAIITTLKNAIVSGRVHHGYLFCGTRGVGKTTTARVFAKSLNCLQSAGPTVSPCLQCDSCQAISEGQDIDVIEIDAASNTGVENIRDLRSNTHIRPARSRLKIYIIDEVHMLSSGAFNALLKTLEEPPEHVKFFLATTELHKVPATIQSRVQRFEFHSIPTPVIVHHLGVVLNQEKIETDETVLRRIAHGAGGSMRDALSLLDQLLSYGDGRLDGGVVDELLPTIHNEHLAAMVDCFASSQPGAALETFERYLGSGQTLERFCENMIEYLRSVMLINVCGPQTELVDLASGPKKRLEQQSGLFSASALVYMMTVMEELRRQVRNSSAGRALADAAVVRLALVEQFSSIPDLLERLEGSSGKPQSSRADSESVRRDRPVDTGKGTKISGAVSSQAAETPGRRVEPAHPTQPSTDAGSRMTDVSKKEADANRGVLVSANNVSKEDVAAARSDPLVREALSLFDGVLINVQKAPAVPDVSAAPGGGNS